jgi:tetratricopeptide (TPR) repeat protein
MLEPKKEELSSSRTIWAIAGRLVDIPFKGNGWVYLGEQENRRGITYTSRRLDGEGQHFIFQAETAGTYTLKFYKQDFIEDYIVNDYVQVIISENPAAAYEDRLVPVERGQGSPVSRQTESASGSPARPSAATADPHAAQAPAAALSADSASSVDYVQQARDAYTAGRFPQAISLLDQFKEQYPAGTDEAWWLYGQSLEANSPSRDIRSALDYYRRLIREYPQSPHGTEAQRRIAYLERYYFNIR